MAEGILVAEQGNIYKCELAELPAPVEAANYNVGVSIKTFEWAKVHAAGALGVAEAKAAKQPQKIPLPLAKKGNEKMVVLGRDGQILELTARSLQNRR